RRRGPALRRRVDVGARGGRHGTTAPGHHRRLGRGLSQGGYAMQTTITARHCEITDALRERARTVVERLGGFAHRPIESAVVFDTDGGQQTAELRLHVARSELLVARGE